MRRTVCLLASVAAATGLPAAFGVSSASAELGCPDTMTPAPAALIRQGDKKDKNENGVVCTKPTTCLEASGPICHGGPDDNVYGGVPMLGTDGTWYYVVDDV